MLIGKIAPNDPIKTFQQLYMKSVRDRERVLEYNGKTRYILYPGDYWVFKGAFYEYIGVFKSLDEVPRRPCIFIIGNRLYRRPNQPIFIQTEEDNKKKRVVDNSRILNTMIRDEDNELMVLVKVLYKNTTLQEFKEYYPDVSEMNNARRTIECAGQGSLSWSRFKDLVQRKGAQYGIEIVHLDDKPSS